MKGLVTMPVECLIGGRQNQSDHTKERGVVKHDLIDSLGRNQELPKHRW